MTGTSVKANDLVTPKKELGSYYTGELVANFVIRWAIGSGTEVVLDPSFGGGVFLHAAAERLRTLSGDPSRQVYGVEIDAEAVDELVPGAITGRPCDHLIRANFFDVDPADLPAMDAVVGNPPFIRYQRFTGDARDLALRRAREAGVELTRLSSSWAPFLVHAVQFIRQGGRLGMVAPAELAHAAYAKPVLQYLCREFRSVRILAFSRRLFQNLSEDTVLVLATDKGSPFEALELVDLPGRGALAQCDDPRRDLPAGVQVDASAIMQGHKRLSRYLLPENTQLLYEQLRSEGNVSSLGAVADVGIGYVTGDNDFFHLDKQTVADHQMPDWCLRPAVRSGSDLRGLRFTREDWDEQRDLGSANQLLFLAKERCLPESIQTYLKHGERTGVPGRYKCRVREPWYCVPHVYQADAFLTYMSGSLPKLVANQSSVVAPNALHVLRLRDRQPGASISALALAALWNTSLTALSCELEGHSLGGGMLKLEPTEAERVAVATPAIERAELEDLAMRQDALWRQGNSTAAMDIGDKVVLQRGMGLSGRAIQELRDGWLTLRTRRLKR